MDDTQSCEGLRCEALYCGHPVWFEWKEYQPGNFANPEPAPNVLARVQKLAALLRKDENPAVFRLPHCLGYFDDAQHDPHKDQEQSNPDTKFAKGLEDIPEPWFRFGFVFAKPRDIHPLVKPASLFQLLHQVRKPSLNSRVELAKILANCIHYLHSVNWLHKGLRSHNVIFFPGEADEQGNGKVDYARPYLSGFDYARPAWREEMTEAPPANPEYDIYKHPRVLRVIDRRGYRKMFDIYSLGILLLEISEWRSVDVIVGIRDPKTARATEISAIRDRLLTEGFMEEVGASMGSLFRASVRFCLGGGAAMGGKGRADETDDAGVTKLSQDFYENVVKHLEDIKC